MIPVDFDCCVRLPLLSVREAAASVCCILIRSSRGRKPGIVDQEKSLPHEFDVDHSRHDYPIIGVILTTMQSRPPLACSSLHSPGGRHSIGDRYECGGTVTCERSASSLLSCTLAKPYIQTRTTTADPRALYPPCHSNPTDPSLNRRSSAI